MHTNNRVTKQSNQGAVMSRCFVKAVTLVVILATMGLSTGVMGAENLLVNGVFRAGSGRNIPGWRFGQVVLNKRSSMSA